MDRIPVESSNVSSIGYDAASNTLEVAFHNGSVYQYADVPASVYHAFMEAPSKGRFVHQHLTNQFRYTKIR